MRKLKPFFNEKTCSLCKKPASIFRVIKDKRYMLCDSKECERKTRIRAGWFNDMFNLKQKGKLI